MDVPEDPVLGRRARRAIPVIAAAMTVIVVAGLLYLRPTAGAVLALPSPSPTARALPVGYQAAYYFVTPSLGWAAVTRNGVGSSDFRIFRTADGAKRWDSQLSGSGPAVGGEPQIKFFDRSHGYAILGRGVVYTTLDGGARWTQLVLPAPLPVEVTFADPAHAWFGAGEVAAKGFGGVQLYATSDGGKDWTRLPDAPGDHFVFRDADEGWIAIPGDKTDALIYLSLDGGSAWIERDLPSAGDTPDGAQWNPPDVRLMPGSGVLAVSGFFAFTSFDLGATWRVLGPMPAGATYADIVFQDATHWWTMPAGNLFRSSDGGQSWQHVTLRIDDWRWSVGTIDSRHAWARLDPPVVRGRPQPGSGLAFTGDGGRTWTYANVPSSF